ncbi:xanthine dehydrogenase accessory protein XdhC [Kordiimonas aestuarii]|uniref:xanthine dehydrogenase accessory protein XdhC n=1 Tax=Kordiimonas aestuarii TaxID=1005925 RepID=UPI0021D335E5|nr:xanthine dehydrogenase accessory protein XdhC [Kordiimonas aestuarii]
MGAGAAGVLVTVAETKGSAPREAGTVMWVTDTGAEGTIGGGNLEYQAIQQARILLADVEKKRTTQTYPLGPLLEQCCGGSVVLTLEKMNADRARASRDAALNARVRYPLYMFGAGHVGKAVYAALKPLPFNVYWVDARDDEFPPVTEPHVITDHASEPVDVVKSAGAQALYLIFTHSHQLDYEITKAVLARGDALYCGLIGSKTKRARFENRLLREKVVDENGLSALTCPIGVPGINGKEPEIIAASVAAELLQRLNRYV